MKVWYKKDNEPDSIWINKEYCIQLNLTGSCPFNCDFCYIRKIYSGVNLEFSKILKLWENLRKYSKSLKIFYRVNITGGDVFLYPKWKDVAIFLSKEKSVKYVDPLLNSFYGKEENKDLLKILKEKITYVQFNLDVVREDDIEAVQNIRKKVVLKISLYEGTFKKDVEKIKKLVKIFGETITVSADLIIPQKHVEKQSNKLCIINDFKKVKEMLEVLKKEFGKLFWVRNPILSYLAFKRRYFCPVPFAGCYIFPDGSISICPRYPHLKSGFTIDNFDLLEYVKKFQDLIATTCLFNNKYFSEFFNERENPLNFI
jgi:MoaA/NifB/PqqE/SkfB family radical SAM enzyme